MTTQRNTLSTAFAIAAALAWGTTAYAQAGHGHGHDHKHAAIGEEAPDFTLTSTDGDQVSLSDFQGKIVVLEWTNHECPVVNRYVNKQKTMQETIKKFKDKDVVWLAIDSSHFSEDKKESINKWRKEVGAEYPTLLDAPGKVGHLYGAKTTPHMYVIDQTGTLVYMGSMDDDKYGGSENAQNYVEQAIEALLNDSEVPVHQTKPFGCTVKYKK